MITDDERHLVYTVLTDNGPDVPKWTPAFGRLVGRVKKAGVLGSYGKTYDWLARNGYFGKKSDGLRFSGDKYF